MEIGSYIYIKPSVPNTIAQSCAIAILPDIMQKWSLIPIIINIIEVGGGRPPFSYPSATTTPDTILLPLSSLLVKVNALTTTWRTPISHQLRGQWTNFRRLSSEEISFLTCSNCSRLEVRTQKSHGCPKTQLTVFQRQHPTYVYTYTEIEESLQAIKQDIKGAVACRAEA